ncbi:MAG: site-specific DNA-methyltransferase [Prevotella sp.]|jgi:adenine specific DNA methylase mod
MPTLHWIGKDKVINHHAEVPFRVLDHKYGYRGEQPADKTATHSGNKIIHGDNLEALKALLPEYEGRVDCIYIDPPYNTGNEGWVYNDNVNDPHIRKWLGEVVGAEGEDLSRHDKWLCMMYPRLRLLQQLLSENGVIFISIDSNELKNLQLICDEVFGSNCFVNIISWQRTYSPRNDSKGIVNEVEYVLVYSKVQDWQPLKLPRTAEMDAKYANPDNDVAPWTSDNPNAPGASTHQGMVYAIQHPFTGELIYPASKSCWRYNQETMLDIMNGWCGYELRDIDDAKNRAAVCSIPVDEVRPNVLAIMLKEPLELSRNKAKEIYDKGPWPKFYFTKRGKGGIRRKTYLTNLDGRVPTNFWPFSEVGHTDEAKKELISIFGGKAPFDTPKPTRLLERMLSIATGKDSIVLDSFAGSGTTAHAVMMRNKEDGGNRKFILIELMDYAESITAERIRRVMNGYGEGKKAVEGLGGSFDYYELGEPLFNEDGTLNEAVGADKIRAYVYYTETHQHLARQQDTDYPYLLDYHGGTGYFFYYEPDNVTTISYDILHIVPQKAEHYVIYADVCTLGKAQLAKMNIVFKKIPRDINRF